MMLKNTLKYSFLHSLPVLFGFLPLGLAYGILMQGAGYNPFLTAGTSTLVLAGSLQFLMVDFLKGNFSILTMVVLSLLLNSRHIFYGLSFIEKFRSFGKPAKWFLIFTLTDESYSLHCSHKITDDINEKQAYVFCGMFVWLYWICFSFLGAFIGNLLPFSTDGVDFALTALFVTILIDQIRELKSPLPAVISAIPAILCLLIFGPDGFILPSLIIIIAILAAFHEKIAITMNLKEDT